jgi:pimeloyl-ACP methyl ester carboxylesterase
MVCGLSAAAQETTSKKETHSAPGRRMQHNRAAMGIRSHHSNLQSAPCQVDGCRIAWEEIPTGDKDAQPIVCLHDAGSGSREFRPLLEHPPAGSRLILLDWPSHGRSGEPATEFRSPISTSPLSPALPQRLTVEYAVKILQAFLNHLQIERPILLGSGFGAAVAIHYAADHPEQIPGLVLCNPAGLVSVFSVGRFSRLLCLLRQAKKSATGQTGSAHDVAAKRQALRIQSLQRAIQPALAEVRESLNHSIPSLRLALNSLSCPTLFALSPDSQRYPLHRYLELLNPSLPHSSQHRFTVFTGAFHPLWDEPERFAQALTSFIQAQIPLEQHTHAWLLTAVDWPTRNSNLWKCVHPDCDIERVLPTGQNANETISLQPATESR